MWLPRYDRYPQGAPLQIGKLLNSHSLEQLSANLPRRIKLRLPLHDGAMMLTDLLPVLERVYDVQVIHRDIKPQNIIRRRRDRRLVLVDFGAVKVATQTALAKTGTSIGSAEYAAPEQIRGKPTFASDLYALGATCVHLLTQMSPFQLYRNYQGCWVSATCARRSRKNGRNSSQARLACNS